MSDERYPLGIPVRPIPKPEVYVPEEVKPGVYRDKDGKLRTIIFPNTPRFPPKPDPVEPGG